MLQESEDIFFSQLFDIQDLLRTYLSILNFMKTGWTILRQLRHQGERTLFCMCKQILSNEVTQSAVRYTE